MVCFFLLLVVGVACPIKEEEYASNNYDAHKHHAEHDRAVEFVCFTIHLLVEGVEGVERPSAVVIVLGRLEHSGKKSLRLVEGGYFSAVSIFLYWS